MTTADAVESEVVTLLRNRVPEFEPSFQRLLAQENYELGTFQTISAFARWLADQVVDSTGRAIAERGFETMELVASTREYPMGTAILAEFVESLWNRPEVWPLMGPGTRAWMDA